MSRVVLPALTGLAVLLGAALAAEIALDGTRGGLPRAAAGRTVAVPAPAPALGSADVQGWVTTILERPLFAPDRRPVSAAAPAAVASQGLPRLAGVVVTPDGRRAIFAAGADGKQIALAENGRIGAFTISRIDADAVTVAGPDGSILLRPSFATGAEAAAKPVAPPPQAAARLPPPGTSPSGLDLLQSSRKFPIPAASKQ
jgi:hypothetical protein